ncbi:MAG: HK97 family phage prohead protease [Planctomycetota bacterium]|nr:HK97 family phage prohead protease [Planctomycetota bacterium]
MSGVGYETADGGTGLRYTSAARSLSQWYRRELRALQAGRDLCHRDVANGVCTQEVADVILAELDGKARELTAGWERSSLRQAVESRAVGDSDFAAEIRVGLATGHSGPSLITHEARSTSRTAVQLRGYGATFNSPTTIGGYFTEEIVSGAFSEVLTRSDCRLLFNHSADHVFARQKGGSLRLKEDSHGLHFVADLLPFDSASYGLARRIEAGIVSGCSFAFSVDKDEWQLAKRPGDLDHRRIVKIGELYDCGPVCFPAYEQTSVHATFVDVTRSAPDQSAADVYDYDEDEHDQVARRVADQDRSNRLAQMEDRQRSRRLGALLEKTRGSRLAAAMNRNREGRLRAYETRFSLCGRR